MSDTMTNKAFARDDKAFQMCCEKAKVEPTARQASKFRNHKGAAYKILRGGK
jgi:hypothetical protein